MHMVFFTTPELLEIGGLPLVTPYDKPTRLEALRYYRRVVDAYGLNVSFHEEVLSIEREDDADDGGMPLFAVTTRSPVGPGVPGPGDRHPDAGGTTAVRRVRHARAIVLAIGYYDL